MARIETVSRAKRSEIRNLNELAREKTERMLRKYGNAYWRARMLHLTSQIPLSVYELPGIRSQFVGKRGRARPLTSRFFEDSSFARMVKLEQKGEGLQYSIEQYAEILAETHGYEYARRSKAWLSSDMVLYKRASWLMRFVARQTIAPIARKTTLRAFEGVKRALKNPLSIDGTAATLSLIGIPAVFIASPALLWYVPPAILAGILNTYLPHFALKHKFVRSLNSFVRSRTLFAWLGLGAAAFGGHAAYSGQMREAARSILLDGILSSPKVSHQFLALAPGDIQGFESFVLKASGSRSSGEGMVTIDDISISVEDMRTSAEQIVDRLRLFHETKNLVQNTEANWLLITEGMKIVSELRKGEVAAFDAVDLARDSKNVGVSALSISAAELKNTALDASGKVSDAYLWISRFDRSVAETEQLLQSIYDKRIWHLVEEWLNTPAPTVNSGPEVTLDIRPSLGVSAQELADSFSQGVYGRYENVFPILSGDYAPSNLQSTRLSLSSFSEKISDLINETRSAIGSERAKDDIEVLTNLNQQIERSIEVLSRRTVTNSDLDRVKGTIEGIIFKLTYLTEKNKFLSTGGEGMVLDVFDADMDGNSNEFIPFPEVAKARNGNVGMIVELPSKLNRKYVEFIAASKIYTGTTDDVVITASADNMAIGNDIGGHRSDCHASSYESVTCLDIALEDRRYSAQDLHAKFLAEFEINRQYQGLPEEQIALVFEVSSRERRDQLISELKEINALYSDEFLNMRIKSLGRQITNEHWSFYTAPKDTGWRNVPMFSREYSRGPTS